MFLHHAALHPAALLRHVLAAPGAALHDAAAARGGLEVRYSSYGWASSSSLNTCHSSSDIHPGFKTVMELLCHRAPFITDIFSL